MMMTLALFRYAAALSDGVGLVTAMTTTTPATLIMTTVRK